MWTCIIREDVDTVEIRDDPVTGDRTIVAPSTARLDEVYAAIQIMAPVENVAVVTRYPILGELADRVHSHGTLQATVAALRRRVRLLVAVAAALALVVAALVGVLAVR